MPPKFNARELADKLEEQKAKAEAEAWEKFAKDFVEGSVQMTLEDLPRAVALGCRSTTPHYLGIGAARLPIGKRTYEELVPQVVARLAQLGLQMGFDVVKVSAKQRYEYDGCGYYDPRDFWELVW